MNEIKEDDKLSFDNLLAIVVVSALTGAFIAIATMFLFAYWALN